jgi:hypothetical protein
MSNTTIPKTKEEIIKGHYTCTCTEIYWSRNMNDPSCVLHEQGGEIELIMEEWAQQEAIGFSKWKDKKGYQIHSNGFYHNELPEAGRQVFFNTRELYLKYLTENQ